MSRDINKGKALPLPPEAEAEGGRAKGITQEMHEDKTGTLHPHEGNVCQPLMPGEQQNGETKTVRSTLPLAVWKKVKHRQGVCVRGSVTSSVCVICF